MKARKYQSILTCQHAIKINLIIYMDDSESSYILCYTCQYLTGDDNNTGNPDLKAGENEVIANHFAFCDTPVNILPEIIITQGIMDWKWE